MNRKSCGQGKPHELLLSLAALNKPAAKQELEPKPLMITGVTELFLPALGLLCLLELSSTVENEGAEGMGSASAFLPILSLKCC